MATMTINRKNTQYGANSGSTSKIHTPTGIYGKRVGGSKASPIIVRHRGRR